MNAVKDKKGNYKFPTIQEDKCARCVSVCERKMPGMNNSQKVFSKSGHRRRVRDINRIRPFHQLSLSSLFYLNRRKF